MLHECHAVIRGIVEGDRMDQKLIRLAAEHVANYSRDCVHLMYALLLVLDGDVARSENTFSRTEIDCIAAELSGVAERLFAIKRRLSSLRHSPEVAQHLDPGLGNELQDLEQLDKNTAHLIGQTALLLRARQVSQFASHGARDFEAAAQTAHTRIREALKASEVEPEPMSQAVWDALSALRSAHGTVPFSEGDEMEHRRWRE